MSKNFELMQNLGVGPQSNSRPNVETRMRIGGERIDIPKTPPRLDRGSYEQSLKLVQRVFITRTQVPSRVVVFSGINSGDGCSTICLAAAKALAANVDGSVCVIDANLRSPSMAASFGLPDHPGLTDALRGEGPIRMFAERSTPANLWLLSSGFPSEGAFSLVDPDRVKTRFAELRKEFDYLLIDTSPLTDCSDAITLGQLADGLVLILEANVTRREAALDVTKNLRAAQVRVLGAVFNKRTFPIPDSVYHRV